MSAVGTGFRSRPLAWLIGIAVAASLAAVFLLAFGGDLAERATAGPGTFSESAIGHRAAYEFLADSGIPCARNHDPGAPALTGDSALVVIEPDCNAEHPLDHGLLPHLVAMAGRRGSPLIVVLPKWLASRSPLDPRYVDGVTPVGDDVAPAVAAACTRVDASTFQLKMATGRATYRADTAWGSTYEVTLSRAQTLIPRPEFEPLISCADGVLAASVMRPGAPQVVLIADPDLIDNQGLGKADHAALLADLVAHLNGVHRLVFDETVHGDLRHGRILASLLSLPALPITLQFLTVALASVWAFSGRFGSPGARREAQAIGREVFVETTARMIEGSLAECSSLARYWRHVAEGVSQARHIPLGDRTENLARLASESSARRTTDDPRALAVEVIAASEGKSRPETWIAVATKIDRWRREMMHGPRTTP